MSTPWTRVGVVPLLLSLGLTLAWVWSFTAWLAVPWHVAGPSMEPTLRSGDRVLVDLWTYRHREPRPGEIALVIGPGGRPIVKRVAEAPGRVGWLRVLGDNPEASLDSRQFGLIPETSARGRVFWLFWPPWRIGPVR